MNANINYLALKNEVANDPLHLGYSGKTDAQVAALGDSLSSAGAATVTMTALSKNAFLAATVAAAVRCATGLDINNAALGAGIAAKWNAVLQQAQNADPGSLINLSLVESGALGSPVADKVMTQAEYNALVTRPGTRFEAAGVFSAALTDTLCTVAEQDVGIARNGS
jgi:hypothetical protein